MRYISFIFIFLVLTGCQDKEVNSLQDRNGIKYEVNAKNPFTGKFIRYWNNDKSGQKKIEKFYKDGKQNGIATAWYKSGKKKEERSYKYGKLDGAATAWYTNSQKKIEISYKNGKQDGLTTAWDYNGQKLAEKFYKNGKVTEKP